MPVKRIRILTFAILFLLLALPAAALAQNYRFSLDALVVDVYWYQDGTATIDYAFTFTNNRPASPIDFVDVGTPNRYFDQSTIQADVNGTPLHDISRSGYQGSGSGVAVGLGSHAIQPGETATVHVVIPNVSHVLRPDSSDPSYASAVFGNTWFGSQYVTGNTAITVTFHLPPGVQPTEPRWHASPSGWASQPQTGFDDQGRVTYTWSNPNASGSQQYLFGASFPAKYVPAGAISSSSPASSSPESPPSIQNPAAFVIFALIWIVMMILKYIIRSNRSSDGDLQSLPEKISITRKLEYLPPKITIEGMGIKRGLTAVEAAILMEESLGRVMTMILFGVLKKNAATVVKKEPMQLSIARPAPDGLRRYEQGFLAAFQENDIDRRRRLLQDIMIELVNTVSMKMKGFSLTETVAYYKDITKRAWDQVEAAQPPDLKCEAFDQNLEWTMIDPDYDRRTQEVFRDVPVYAPVWWGRYDPGYRPVSTGGGMPSVSVPSGRSGTGGLPALPGANFAASLANGVQSFSSGVIGDVADFTSGVASSTNPDPVSTSGSHHGSGAGHSCACACACAGCACACAGGGR